MVLSELLLCEVAAERIDMRWFTSICVLGKIFSPTNLFRYDFRAQTWADAMTRVRNAKREEIRFHYVRICVLDGSVAVFNVNLDKNISDWLTKTLDRAEFKKLRDSISLTSLPTTIPRSVGP